MVTHELMKIVIVGAGGFGREVLWTLRDCNKVLKKYNILGFIDDDKELKNENICGIPILGGLEWFSDQTEDIYCAVATGDPKIRKSIVDKLKKNNVKFPTIVHPSVINSEYVKFGRGSIIQAGCILSTNIEIKEFVHINMDSTIAHDCIIEDFVTISPGVHINGNISIGENTYIGTGTVTKEKITIGKYSVVGAGTVLIDDVQDFSLYVGIPGKFKKKIVESDQH